MDYLRAVINTCIDFLFPTTGHDAECATLSPTTFAQRATCSVPIPISDAFALFSYNDPLVRKSIWSLKYYGNRRIAELFGTLLASFLTEELAERQQFGSFHAPLIVPIPLHKKKEKERGFNQSLLIARAVARSLTCAAVIVEPHALVRIINTESLARVTASRQKRIERMRGAFAVSDSARIQGRDIILVDDVITTGATTNNARSALYDAGARNVIIIAVAH